MNKNYLLSSALFILCQIGFSQVFLPEYKNAGVRVKGFVELNDGQKVNGYISSISMGPGYISALQFQTDGKGEKKKYKSEELKGVYIEATAEDKFASIPVDNKIYLSAKKNQERKDKKELIKNLDYFVWKKVKDEKGKEILMQLVNPGFDSKMQVYIDRKGATSQAGSIAGFSVGKADVPQSYYIVKEGGEAMRIGSSKYKKLFPTLFKTCPDLYKQVDKISWNDLAVHVYFYDSCN